MATQTWQAAPSNTSDALFRLWGKGISDAFQALGVTKTSDTGQIDWATVVKPIATVVAGYEIRQFTDSLQSSNPVYIRIGYGAPIGANVYYGLTIQVGHAADGACGLLGPRTDAIIISYAGTNATLRDFYAASDGGRLSLIGSPCNVAGMTLTFSIERTKDNNGVPTEGGVNLVGMGGYSGQTWQQFLPKLGGPYPAAALVGFQCASPVSGFGTYAGNIGLYPIYPTQGMLGNPDMGALVYFVADIASAATVITLSVYGASHNFMTAGSGTIVLGNNGNANVVSLAVRYE